MIDSSNMISVIVPFYNAEKTIEECIQSVLNQTYTNFELILVDDGSSDNSDKIINEIIKQDSRIVLYKKNNGGVSSARNLGISKAKGEYIIFIDSDDQIHYQALEILMSVMKKNDTDLVVYKYTLSENGIKSRISDCKVETIDKIEYFHEMFIPRNNIAAFAWNRIYKKSIIRLNSLEFDEDIKVCEDTLFNYLYAKKCRYILSLDISLYYYNINNNSAMFSDKFNINKLSANVVYDYLLGYEIDNRVLSDIQISCMWFNEIILQQIIKQKISISTEIKLDIQERLKINPKGFLKSSIPVKYKLAYLFYLLKMKIIN